MKQPGLPPAQMQQLRGMNLGDVMGQFGVDGGGMPEWRNARHGRNAWYA